MRQEQQQEFHILELREIADLDEIVAQENITALKFEWPEGFKANVVPVSGLFGYLLSPAARITALDLSHANLGAGGAALIAKLLESSHCTLTYLNLTNTSFQFDREAASTSDEQLLEKVANALEKNISLLDIELSSTDEYHGFCDTEAQKTNVTKHTAKIEAYIQRNQSIQTHLIDMLHMDRADAAREALSEILGPDSEAFESVNQKTQKISGLGRTYLEAVVYRDPKKIKEILQAEYHTQDPVVLNTLTHLAMAKLNENDHIGFLSWGSASNRSELPLQIILLMEVEKNLKSKNIPDSIAMPEDKFEDDFSAWIQETNAFNPEEYGEYLNTLKEVLLGIGLKQREMGIPSRYLLSAFNGLSVIQEIIEKIVENTFREALANYKGKHISDEKLNEILTEVCADYDLGFGDGYRILKRAQKNNEAPCAVAKAPARAALFNARNDMAVQGTDPKDDVPRGKTSPDARKS